MVLLEFGPCYLAAQKLQEDQPTTLGVTVLFVVALAGGEFGLDWAARHDARPTWRRIGFGLGAFVLTLGLLRLYFLTVTGAPLLDAVLAAGLLTAATAVFVVTGYLALRVAETPTAWRLRRAARRQAMIAAAAAETARQARAFADRLVGALVAELQPMLLQRTTDEAAARRAQSAVHRHLTTPTLPPTMNGPA